MKDDKGGLLWRIPIISMRVIMVTTTTLLVLTIFFSVCMRYILKSDLFAIEEIVTLVAMWLFFISAGYGSYDNSHIRADLLSNYVKSEKVKHVFDIVRQVINMLILGVFVWWSIQFASWSIEAGAQTVGWKIPFIYSQIPITIGFTVMLLYTIYHLVNTIRGKEPQNEEGGE